ncbi:cupin domain-containing protein, partial [Mesorhizobium sp. M7D.F.Ca.US.004.01.2.1]
MLKLACALALLLVGTAPLFAHDAPINADEIKWGPAPAVLPAGAQIAVVAGDPSKDGIYVLRLKMPAGYKIPAHNHPTSEYV